MILALHTPKDGDHADLMNGRSCATFSLPDPASGPRVGTLLLASCSNPCCACRNLRLELLAPEQAESGNNIAWIEFGADRSIPPVWKQEEIRSPELGDLLARLEQDDWLLLNRELSRLKHEVIRAAGPEQS